MYKQNVYQDTVELQLLLHVGIPIEHLNSGAQHSKWFYSAPRHAIPKIEIL